MDGRGPWDLAGSIGEHQQVMAWYGQRNIPVELNEPHHWGMRDAPDVIFVVSAYLSAYNARAYGVRDYIAQLMFNSRTGLLSYPLDLVAARAHLAASIYLQMALQPHIVHVVGHTEAHHAATAEDVIEAGKLARQAIENALRGAPDMTADPAVQVRREELVGEARVTLAAISSLARPGANDPLTDPITLAQAVAAGVLDAPQLRNNPFARGQIVTRIDERGACVVVDATSGLALTEEQRLARLGVSIG